MTTTPQQHLNTLTQLARAEPDYQNIAEQLKDLSNTNHQTPTELATLAQDTLSFLSQQNPQYAQAITAMNQAEAPAQFDFGTSTAVLVAVAVLLRSHVKFQKDKQGKWTFSYEHKPMESKLLGAIIEKLKGFE